VLLAYTGRTSDRPFTIPVGDCWVATVKLELHGCHVTAHAKAASNHIGLALDIKPPPTWDELARALQGRTVIRLRGSVVTRSVRGTTG
jgi:hypothetical protein